MFKVDDWKPGRPKFLTIEEEELARHDNVSTSPVTAEEGYATLLYNLREVYKLGYSMYEENLAMGFDPGLARDCLPVGIYSSCWVSCNARSLMSYLSLRTHDPEALKVSYPLYEIEVAARKVEDLFQQYMPITYKAFVDNGRLAP